MKNSHYFNGDSLYFYGDCSYFTLQISVF